MPARFNPPPGWPTPPPGWSPPSGWKPDPSWSPAPRGWRFWIDEPAVGVPAPASALSGSSTADRPRLGSRWTRMLRSNPGWLVVAFFALLGLVAGPPGVFLFGGAATIVLAVVRVLRWRPRPHTSRRSRRPALITAVGGLAAVITGTALAPAAPPAPIATTSASPAPPPTGQ